MENIQLLADILTPLSQPFPACAAMVSQNSAFFLSPSPKLTVPLPLLWSKFGGGILRCEEGGRGREAMAAATKKLDEEEEKRSAADAVAAHVCLSIANKSVRVWRARRRSGRGSTSSSAFNEMATGWPASRILPSRLKTRSWRSAVAFHAGCRCTAGNATAVAFSPSCVRSPVRPVDNSECRGRTTDCDRPSDPAQRLCEILIRVERSHERSF